MNYKVLELLRLFLMPDLNPLIENDAKLAQVVKLIGIIYCRFFLSKYVHFTSLPSKLLIL